MANPKKLSVVNLKGTNEDRLSRVIPYSAFGVTSDEGGRLVIGNGVRRGGVLYPAPYYAPVTGQVALAQGKYIFNQANTLYLPDPTATFPSGEPIVVPGEYVEVTATIAAIAAVDPCYIRVSGSNGIIVYSLNGVVNEEFNQLDFDFDAVIKFILDDQGRWNLRQ